MNRIALFGFVWLLASCGFRNTKVLIQQDPVVKLTSDVKKIAVVNLVKNSPTKKVGAILLGEIPSNDEKWSAQFVQTCGKRVAIAGNNAVEMQPVPFNNPEKSSFMYQFSIPLDWTLVDSICKVNHSQGLLTVDYFGAVYDMNIVQNSIYNTSPGLNTLNPTANGTLRGFAGFRYYDMLTGQILIQQPLEYYNQFGQNNNNRVNLYIQRVPVSTLLTGEAYRYVAEDMGEYMASYFVHTTYWGYRKLCKSGGNDIKTGFRYARSGNWSNAVEIWQGIYSTTKKSSEKWRAAYNLAVYYEIMGMFDESEKYLSEAYALSGKRKVYKYMRIITQRRNRLQQLR